MGQKHRDLRKRIKAEERKLRALGWKENELGELKKHTTKAEARRQFILNVHAQVERHRAMMAEIIDRAAEAARQDIYRIEDERVFGAISEATV